MIHTQLHYIGRPVRSLQTMLRALSYVYPFLPRVTPDGVFGEATLEAVMLLQREFFPPVTGRVNLATWEGITALYRRAERASRSPSPTAGDRNRAMLRELSGRLEFGPEAENGDALERLHRLFVTRAPAERPG